MPTRIKPNRVGYSGYTCVGIPRPCIDDMDSTTNRFDKLPKFNTKQVWTAPYYDQLSTISDEKNLPSPAITDYDPLNGGNNIDLYGRIKAIGAESVLGDNNYPYNCCTPTGPPQDSLSKRQPNAVELGFMDPPMMNIELTNSRILHFGDESSSSSSQSESDGISSPSSQSGESGFDCNTPITVVTQLRLTEDAILEWDRQDITVCAKGDSTGFETVPGWVVTECDY